MAFKLGNHEVRDFNGLDATFGADIRDYPKYDDIPEEFRRHHGKFNKVASSLFFEGGSLAKHGLEVKPEVDGKAFHTALRALLCSFAPKHEVKEGTVAWMLSEYTQPLTA